MTTNRTIGDSPIDGSPINSSPINNSPIPYNPLAIVVSAWDQNRVTLGSKHYVGVTIANRGDQDAVVQVRLESPSPMLQQWCPQPEQWLALTRNKSGELTFCIAVPGDVLPQWFDYEVVARPQGAYADYFLPATRCRLQILAPEASETTQDATFSLTPPTSPDRPLIVPPDAPVTLELVVDNRADRVDRFRLECTGLPQDWGIQVEYPRDHTGLGLVRYDDSVGINPGDRGLIRVLLQPPRFPLAGSYLPTLRITSENNARLGLLALVYLCVEPVYRLQTQLQVVQEDVRDRPAQFTLELANLGNTPRQVQLALNSLAPPDCTYTLSATNVILPPQTVRHETLEGQPQRGWTRSWFGSGKRYRFQVALADVDRLPLPTETLPGHLTWMPRPWWQLLLALLAALGLLGALAFLIWWNFLRPPTPPKLLEFAPEDSRYAEVNNDMARVRWQIEHPEQIQTLTLTGHSPDGQVLSGPLVYEFKDGKLPAALQSFCTQQNTLLSCSQVRTDAFQPGKYVFELTLLPKGGSPATVQKTSPIEITAKPLPTVTSIVPKSLVYREATPGIPTSAEKALPVADQDGVRLDWIVTMPSSITALHLVGRDKDGKMVGNLWFEFPSPGELPPGLRPFCKLEPVLLCRDVPTGLNRVGEYRFELEALTADRPVADTGDRPAAEVKPKFTEVVKIQPQTPQILSFQINGREAPAKLLLPIVPSQTPPTIQVSWQVQAGSSTRVELTPTPGSVPLVGRVSFPLSPQGSTTIALQVKAATGEVLTRSVTLETYDPSRPTPAPPSVVPAVPAPSGSPPASPVAPSPAPAGSPAPTPFGAPSPTVDDRLSPSEQPPQFNR